MDHFCYFVSCVSCFLVCSLQPCFLCFSLFCYALLCVHSSFAFILKRKGQLVALLLLSYRCIVTINVIWLILKVTWVGLQFVIVVFPDHTHLHFVVTCWGRAGLLTLLCVMLLAFLSLSHVVSWVRCST